MSPILELGAAVQMRRSDMGLSQTALAKLSGLSRATINQLENGAIKDLSITRVGKLLETLGLGLNFTPPRPKPALERKARTPALELAARTASVSYRNSISAAQLKQALTTSELLQSFKPHLHALLDEAPPSLLAAVVEQLHGESKLSRAELWAQMRILARSLKSSRELWQ